MPRRAVRCSGYLGLGCDPKADLPGPPATDTDTEAIAVVQRGDCTFATKALTALNNGYEGLVVFNDAARGDALVRMIGERREIPGVFVGHATGVAIFGAESAEGLQPGQAGAPVAATAQFDGWGYFHLLDRSSLSEAGYYARPGQRPGLRQRVR
ncbi:MAG TPA: PA domain-containing protein [Nitriliruptorales bacterium]|nr:PA domain-containing protein [Nitriliruptorales bacterium]